ncbi:MAG: ribosome maturation factor RimP [Clostridia bacterium]|nr:ribosome maturation factor RimP [Clostridia bacterium]
MASKGKGGNTVAAVWEIVAPIAEELGLSIWDIRFQKEGVSWYLRIFIDKEGGVGITDCENFSRAVDAPLDEADPIEQSYYLEVSSPGVERQLTRDEHFKQYIGEKIILRLIRPKDGEREFRGILEDYDSGLITVSLEDGGFSVDKKEVSFVKLDDFEM